MADLSSLGVGALRRLVAERGLDARGCVEKADLVALLAQTPPDDGFDASALGVRELKRLLALHGVAVAGGVVEKPELVAALRARLAACPICLCEPDGPTVRCGACRARFDRGCAARHCVTAAEQAKLPVKCPSCAEAWPSSLIAAALAGDAAGKRRYNVAVRGVNELREARRLDQRQVEELKQAGVRQCPGCGALVSKVEATDLSAQFGVHGCDKMTCRCGTKFCFACGARATPAGLTTCSCAPGHAFLSHDSVMNNYQDQPDIDGMLGNLGGVLGNVGAAVGAGVGEFMRKMAEPER